MHRGETGGCQRTYLLGAEEGRDTYTQHPCPAALAFGTQLQSCVTAPIAHPEHCPRLPLYLYYMYKWN